MRRILRIPVLFHRAFVRAMDHDCFNLAQSSAYSAMVALFPALIVAATIISLLPDTTPIRHQFGVFFDRILPPNVTPLLDTYFGPSPHNPKSTRALILALLVSVTGASSVISTLMEGIRRSHNLPPDCWTFWSRRARAYALVPLSLIPFGVASLMIVFGDFFTTWLALHLIPSVRTPIYAIAIFIRWTVALTGNIGIVALIYHMGTPFRQHWRTVLPGAVAATFMWFVTTLIFGWYVTRFANYSQVYGSLGAGIALLFWLYIVSLSVLFGTEFNHEFHIHFSHPIQPYSTVSTPDMPSHG